MALSPALDPRTADLRFPLQPLGFRRVVVVRLPGGLLSGKESSVQPLVAAEAHGPAATVTAPVERDIHIQLELTLRHVSNVAARCNHAVNTVSIGQVWGSSFAPRSPADYGLAACIATAPRWAADAHAKRREMESKGWATT